MRKSNRRLAAANDQNACITNSLRPSVAQHSVNVNLFDLFADAVADRLFARIQPVSSGSGEAALLTEPQVKERYGIGRTGLDVRGCPKAKCGRAYRWRVSDVEACLKSEPPRAKPKKSRLFDDEDPIDALLRSGALVATRGAK